MATEKTTEIKSYIFFSYRAWSVPWDAPILAKNKDFFFPLSANADEMEANGPLKKPPSSFVSTYSKNAVPLANSDNTVCCAPSQMKPLLTNQSDTEILLTNPTASSTRCFAQDWTSMDSILSWKLCNKTIYKKPKEVVTREKQELKLCTKLWLLSIFYQQATLSISFPHRLKEANSFLPVHSWMLSTKQQYRKSAWNDELTCKRRRHGHAVDQSLDVITMSTPPRRQDCHENDDDEQQAGTRSPVCHLEQQKRPWVLLKP
jgi:hypothetical protein